MPKYRIHVVNSDFDACEEVDLPNFDAARSHGVMGALRIGCDELCKGEVSFFGAELRVEVDGHVHARMVIAMGASPLNKVT